MNTTSSTATLIPTDDPNPQACETVRFNALKHGKQSRYTMHTHESQIEKNLCKLPKICF